MTRIIFDNRTPFILDGGIVLFALLFAKFAGFIPKGSLRTIVRRRKFRLTSDGAPPDRAVVSD